MNVSAPDPGPRAPRGDGPGAGAKNGRRNDSTAPNGPGRGAGGQQGKVPAKPGGPGGPGSSDRQGKPGGSDGPGKPGNPGKSRKEQRQRRRSARTADQGVSLIEKIVLDQRALDRERLDEYARMVAAAVSGDTSAELAFRSLRAELATALHMSEFTVERELDLAHTVATRYPAVSEVLGAGLIGMQHVQVICDAGVIIGSGQDSMAKHTLYEAAVLEYAVEETPGRLRPIAKRLAEQFAEVSLEERHTVARKRRRIEVLVREDGMAELYAFLPAEVAYAIQDRVHRIAKQAWLIETAEAKQTAKVKATAAAEAAAAGDGVLGQPGAPDSASTGLTEDQACPSRAGAAGSSASASAGRRRAGGGDPDEPGTTDSSLRPRTLNEVRADTLTELLLTGTPYTDLDLDLSDGSQANTAELGFLAHLQVMVPIEALTPGHGWPRPVCELAGYGPISALVAQDLLEASRNIYRVDVDDGGTVLRVDRYKPTKAMKALLGARDQHCRFPGCMRLPMSCDIDHTIAWEDGGKTATDNLAHLCRSHHVLKHHSVWKPVLDETGTMTWQSPTGRVHSDRPAGRTRWGSAPGGGRGIGGFGWWPQTARGPDCPPTAPTAPTAVPAVPAVPAAAAAAAAASAAVQSRSTARPDQLSRVGQTMPLHNVIPELRTGTTVRFGNSDGPGAAERGTTNRGSAERRTAGAGTRQQENPTHPDTNPNTHGQKRTSNAQGLSESGTPRPSTFPATGLNTNAGAIERSNVNANSGQSFNVEATINAAPAGYAVRDRLTPLERHALTCGCDIPGYHDPDYMAELDEQARRNGTNTGEQPF